MSPTTPTPSNQQTGGTTATTDSPGTGGATARPRRRLEPSIVIGGSLVALVVLAALLSLIWTPHDPIPVNVEDRLQPSSAEYLLGTDRYGRDVLSILMYGARLTLLIGLTAVAVAAVLGVPAGIAAAMGGRRIDAFIMRIADVALAFPALLLVIVFGAAFGAGTWTAVAALGLAAAPSFARVARAGALQVVGREYVTAARAANRTPLYIAVRHVLPNISGLLIVQASVAFAIAVLAEAALSYLGFGTEPPTPSWGRLLQESQSYLYDHPMLVVWPGIAIGITVLGLNLLGDGLRDRFDPRMEGRR